MTAEKYLTEIQDLLAKNKELRRGADAANAELARLRAIVEKLVASIENSKASVEEAIRDYRLQYMVIADDGDAYPLLDLLSGNSGTVKQGLDEMELLVDAACGAILDATREAAEAAMKEKK